MAVSDIAQGYTPHPEYVEDGNEPLHHNLTDSTELWLVKLPLSNDLLSDIEEKELSLWFHNDGKLTSFEGSSEKAYDFLNYTTEEPDESVFIKSATEPKIAGRISRRVSVVHYTDPIELERHSSTNARQNRNSTGVTNTTSSRYFPMQSGTRRSLQSGRASSSKGSRQKSSLSEAAEPSSTPKRKSMSKSNISKSPSKSHASGLSHGHSSGVSEASDHSLGGKSKKSKHKE